MYKKSFGLLGKIFGNNYTLKIILFDPTGHDLCTNALFLPLKEKKKKTYLNEIWGYFEFVVLLNRSYI